VCLYEKKFRPPIRISHYRQHLPPCVVYPEFWQTSAPNPAGLSTSPVSQALQNDRSTPRSAGASRQCSREFGTDTAWVVHRPTFTRWHRRNNCRDRGDWSPQLLGWRTNNVFRNKITSGDVP